MQPLSLKNDSFEIINLGLNSYESSRNYIRNILHPEIKETKKIKIVFAKHPPVITLGNRLKISALPSEVLKNLESINIPLIETDRGGLITFHDPHQLMIYPVLDLRKNMLSVKSFIYNFLKVISLICKELGLNTSIDNELLGIWSINKKTNQKKKIASCGFRIKNSLSDHGAAVYVSEISQEFSLFRPCGISHKSLTSFKEELGERFNSDIIENSFYTLFPKYFIKILRENTRDK